ncbi:sialidase family protein [Rhodoferax sp. PAMC 29310]|uniref:exo-alpha-sialidase n=1 Tax=Rhodoferax sp. PAMC 29310 TaxID=2822760 RepID=UPI001B33B38C|nr:sialidase family protein [Rhodoferax sp. PAMC 29310]
MFDAVDAAIHRSVFERWVVGLVVCLVLVVWDVSQRDQPPSEARAAWVVPQEMSDTKAWVNDGQGLIPMPANTPAAHASSLVAMPKGSSSVLSAFWFAGARESAPDVQIVASQFDRATRQWSEATFVVNRDDMAAQLGFGVRRLGNPVVWADAQGRIHLFVVATGLGGWAAARIVHLRQRDPLSDLDIKAFEVLRPLPLSWLWNTSFLVRAAPMALQDGGMVLPVHFELGIKYPVALRFDASGDFQGMVRMSRRTHVLQPTLLPMSDVHWLALMRDQRPNGKVTAVETRDGGRSWVDLPDLHLDNPDASVAGLAVAPGQMFLAHNSSPHSRTTLDLSRSSSGVSWTLMQRLAHGETPAEFSYPAVTWAEGHLWTSYTDRRQQIAWQRFAKPKTSP